MPLCSRTCCSFDYKISFQFWGIYRLRIQPPLPAVTGVWYQCRWKGLSLLLFKGWEGNGEGASTPVPPVFLLYNRDYNCLELFGVTGQLKSVEDSQTDLNPASQDLKGQLKQMLGESMRHRANVLTFHLADPLSDFWRLWWQWLCPWYHIYQPQMDLLHTNLLVHFWTHFHFCHHRNIRRLLAFIGSSLVWLWESCILCVVGFL